MYMIYIKQAISIVQFKHILFAKQIYYYEEKVSTDDHQFHQYQQNEQSPLILTELTEHKKKPTTYYAGNPGACLGHAQQCGGANPVNGITILPVNNFINYFQKKYNKY